MHSVRLYAVSAAMIAVLTACSDSTPVFHQSDNPQRLSKWSLFSTSNGELVPSEASLVFLPANRLFTDYAQKLRTLWMPDGAQALLVDGEIEYPVGTVLSKTFYYPQDSEGNVLNRSGYAETTIDLENSRLIETRLLVRRESGWVAFPYVWNEEQSEAFLRVAGTSRSLHLKSDTGNLEFVYFVPNENQCSGCHVTSHPDGDMHPLGAIASQLTSQNWDLYNGDVETQTELLVARGWLDKTPILLEPISWQDERATIEDRALAYLNSQCGHCHNPDGPADTSALLLDGSHTLPVNMGVCKTPVAAGGGAGDMFYSIVPGAPERSILLYRMRSTEPDEMMPELGRSLIHTEGIDLISRWISQMPGSC